MNNHHISYSFSNHSLYISASELHRSTSIIVYCAMNNHHVSYSFSNYSLYTSVGKFHRSTSRLCIALRITTISLILSPIIFSILQQVSYIEVEVDCVLRYE